MDLNVSTKRTDGTDVKKAFKRSEYIGTSFFFVKSRFELKIDTTTDGCIPNMNYLFLVVINDSAVAFCDLWSR